MLHPRYRLINQSNKIIIDPEIHPDSDIDEPQTPPTQNHGCHSHPLPSLLASINLKNRRVLSPCQAVKREVVVINDREQEEDEESVVFVRKVTNPQNFKKHLRRLATVPNKIKLERKDQNVIECSICLSDLKDKEERKVGKLACRHIFCFSCILQSSKFSNKCPYCRAPFNQIRRGKRIVQVAEVRQNPDMGDSDQPCYICGRNDDFERLLECQYCQYAYCHTYCDNRLNSDLPPQQEWFCLSCQDLLRNQQLQGQPQPQEQVEIYEQDD